jgi:hypothetical protein
MEKGGGWRDYTPAESGDWDPVPTKVGGALDQLAGRAIKHFDATILVEALGSGASDSIAIPDFPTNVIYMGVAARANPQFTGEADLSFEVGFEGGDVDALIDTTALHETGNGTTIAVVTGVMKAGQFYADASADGLAALFSATELDDVSAGSLTLRFFYIDAF